jgi:hypothetical protein
MFVLNTRNRYSKLIRAGLCAFSLGIYLSSCAMSFADSGTDTELNKLETKLFQHTYAKDTPDTRIDRLEKLIFGESQKGSVNERVSALVKAVPNLDSPPPVTASENSTAANQDDNAKESANQEKPKHKKSKSENIAADDAANDSVSVGNYPAVTAMETKLLGKDHAQEPIQDRLARLEKKVLGSVSTSDDLSERVDKLKSATGIDIARKPSSATDWIEDDDDMLGRSPSGRGGDTDLSTHDAYKDMQSAYGTADAPYTASQNPFDSPYFSQGKTKAGTISIKSFGLSQQVTALEHEIYGKSYEHDPLPARVNRLEATVFPGEKPAVDKPLPDRVQTLLAKVPIRQDELRHLAKIYQIEPDQDSTNTDPNDPAAIQRSRGNLNKIMNSLSNMLSGGMQGGYPMQSGNYVVDPASGLLVNPNTGYVVNPNTGTTYNTRRNTPYGMGNYGYSNYNNSYNSMYPFGSPMGSSYGMGGMGGMGFGGGGMGFGGGGMGFGFR